MRESLITRGARWIVRRLLKPILKPGVPRAFARLWVEGATRTLRVPRGLRIERLSLGGVPVERIAPPEAATGRTVLYLHGGGYVSCSARTHRSITGSLARHTGFPVHAADYRLAPEHPFPAALDDALACYRALLDGGYRGSGIVLAGDSAGGGLALALALKARELGLPAPAGIALISPWVDLACADLAPVEDDVLLDAGWLHDSAAAYLGTVARTEPLASPIHANLRGLAPVFIQAAGEEILLHDARRLAAALRAASGTVELEEHPRMWHDFQLYTGIVPEATQAMRHMGEVVAQWLR